MSPFFAARAVGRATALLAALCCAPLVAQNGDQQPEPVDPTLAPKSIATSIHEAWLLETLDLDLRGAADAYDRIQRSGGRRPERWIAVTRLAELRRLGVRGAEPVGVERAPEPLRKAIEDLPALPSAAQLLADPSEELLLPPLHTASEAALRWVRERIGQSNEERARTVRHPRTPTWIASYVLWSELGNRQGQAEAYRKIDFPNWKPLEIVGEPTELLATVRERLTAWIEEVEPKSRQQELLRALLATIEKQAKQSPMQALQLVSRIPVYAERLLLDQRAAGDGEANRR